MSVPFMAIDERKRFEEWAQSRKLCVKRTGKSGRYDDPGVNAAWLKWRNATGFGESKTE